MGKVVFRVGGTRRELTLAGEQVFRLYEIQLDGNPPYLSLAEGSDEVNYYTGADATEEAFAKAVKFANAIGASLEIEGDDLREELSTVMVRIGVLRKGEGYGLSLNDNEIPELSFPDADAAKRVAEAIGKAVSHCCTAAIFAAGDLSGHDGAGQDTEKGITFSWRVGAR